MAQFIAHLLLICMYVYIYIEQRRSDTSDVTHHHMILITKLIAELLHFIVSEHQNILAAARFTIPQQTMLIT